MSADERTAGIVLTFDSRDDLNSTSPGQTVNPTGARPNHVDYGTVLAVPSPSTPEPLSLPPTTLPQALTRMHIYVLVSGCILVFGNYYCYDLPAALNVPLRSLLGSSYSTFQWQLNFLYTIYSAPNILMPLIGGALYDRLGPRAMLLTFSALVVFGGALFWIGLALRSFPLLLAGRLLGGLGGESLEVAATSITTTWFQDAGYLSLALGINLSTSRIAAAVQDSITPWVVTLIPLDTTSWLLGWTTGPALAAAIGLFLCILSVAAAFALIRADSPAARVKAGLRSESPDPVPSLLMGEEANVCLYGHHDSDQGHDEHRRPLLRPPSPSLLTAVPNSSSMGSIAPSVLESDAATVVCGLATQDHYQSRNSIPNSRLLSPLSAVLASPHSPSKSSTYSHPGLDSDRVSIRTTVSGTPLLIHEHQHHSHDPFHPMHTRHRHENHLYDTQDGGHLAVETSSSASHDLPRKSSVLGLGSSFWILCMLTVLLYGSVMPFIHISSDFIQSKWYPRDLPRAGALMSLPDLLCAVLTPLLGFAVDKIGNPARFLPLSGFFLTVAHLLLFFTSFPPAPALVLLGIASATFAATLWPCVPLLVPDNALGTAYGAVTVALNAALAGVPLFVAGLNGHGSKGEGNWDKVGALFVVTSVGATLVSIVLLVRDWTSGACVLWIKASDEGVRPRQRIHAEDEDVNVSEQRRLLDHRARVEGEVHHRKGLVRSGTEEATLDKIDQI